MKIGIITYHRSQNYGAQLQAYASRMALNKMGYEADVLDCNTIGDAPLFEWHFHSLRAIIGSFKYNLLRLLFDRKRIKRFRNFSENMIGISSPCLSQEDLRKKVEELDYVITGSDQVWNPQICEGQTCFFLDFPIKSWKKIAYAPSFGVSDYTQAEVEKYIPLIEDIKHLSVREERGREIIKKYTGRNAKIVVDPTMLLTKEDWNKITKSSKYKKYIFYFTILDEQSGTDALVKQIAKERNLEIVRIGGVRDILEKDYVNARESGPQEFLGLVRDADFVVTSSFHGTVFSILFEKQFLCVLNNNNRNSRMETLTNFLGLSNRLVYNPSEYNYKDAFNKIEYSKVIDLLKEKRIESLSFFKESIK